MFACEQPNFYNIAIEVWIKAMDEEIASIKRNKYAREKDCKLVCYLDND